MSSALFHVLRAGIVTQGVPRTGFPPAAAGLPMLSEEPCTGNSCSQCVAVCPTEAISLGADPGDLALDLGRCIGCGLCVEACPTGSIVAGDSTQTASSTREGLVLRAGRSRPPIQAAQSSGPFRRSLHFREVSTGCPATDLEVQAALNPIFDAARFGIHVVASPRHADVLLVTGPVGLGMRDALLRCYEAMAEPRLVIACGTCAVSGGIHGGGYAQANGVGEVLPVDVFIPGCPPHPWSIIHGLEVARVKG